MKASSKCIDLIRRFEGFKSAPYRCPAGVATIGFGSTRYADGRAVSLKDDPITEAQALDLLHQTLTQYEQAVSKAVKVPINQNQFDALVDFAYNAGAGNMASSTLVKKLNAGDLKGASAEFDRWVFAAGVRLRGLTLRRQAERELFEA